MGGPGSGQWYRWQDKKSTVEGCRSLDVNRWMREGIIRAGSRRSGSWVWSDADTGEVRSTISYEAVAGEDGSGTVRLIYTMTRTGEALDYRVALQATRPPFGGLRWWFTCPLVTNGRPCRRRVTKLYLRGRYFGCRHCHDLTYTSCQECHQTERLETTLVKLLEKEKLFDPSTATPGELLCILRGSRLDEVARRQKRRRIRPESL